MTNPLSSGSAEALVGVACVSVQSVVVTFVPEVLSFPTLVVAFVRVTVLVHLHMLLHLLAATVISGFVILTWLLLVR